MQCSAHFHRIHVIDCLPPKDTGGAQRLFSEIEIIAEDAGAPKPTYQKIDSAASLINELARLAKKVTPHDIPLIHIDAHGNKEHGIKFKPNYASSPTYLSWEQLADQLREINLKTQNRLVFLSCICFGFYLCIGSNENYLEQPAPFSVGVLPVGEVSLKQLEAAIPKFYRALVISRDFHEAVKTVDFAFALFTSENFLKDVLLTKAQSTMGRLGRQRREHLLTEGLKYSKNTISVKKVRAYVKKDYLKNQIHADLSSKYLCGRPAPFTAEQIISEAKARHSQERTKDTP